MKLFLIGWFGAGNMGDEAILLSELLFFKKHLPDAQFYILSFDFERTRKMTAHISEVKKIVQIGSKDNFFQSHFLALFKTMKTVDTFVIGGGGIFQDIYNHYPIPFFTLFSVFARIFMKHSLLYSVGFGPVHTTVGMMLCRLAVSLTPIVSVRDHQSKQLIKDAGSKKGVHVTADPVFLLEPARTPSVIRTINKYSLDSHAGPKICLCVQDLLYWPDDTRKMMGEVLDSLILERNTKIIFLPFGQYADKWFDEHAETVDLKASKNIAQYMKEKPDFISEEMKPQELLTLIEQFDLVISMRLHGIIMGLSMTVPVIALTYEKENKIANLMKRVDQANNLFYIEKIEKTKFCNAINNSLDNLDTAKTQIAKSVTRLREKCNKFNQYLITELKNKPILG